ncbi:MAG: SMC-Scp complex subunit ScpB [Nitrospira sp.]|nr:SMC-Scp complex subunit ScpB [Nitrospira sp.]
MTDQRNGTGGEIKGEPAETTSLEDSSDAIRRAEVTEPQTIESDELKGIVESLLFVSQEPLSIQRLVAVIGNVTKTDVSNAIRNLEDELAKKGRGIRLVEVAGGFRLVTKQEYAPWVKRLDKAKATTKLSRSALESLAIIAYKQPIVKAEIEEIRGVETSAVVRTLLERKLVRIVGRKEVPGRPIMYGTTKYFLEHFGLKDLSQLPPLREFKELGEAEQPTLPMDGAESFKTNGSLHVSNMISVDSAVAGEPTSSPTADKQDRGERTLEEERESVPSTDAGASEVFLSEPVEQT